ncbi:Hypp8459 [Branchiostoma lanceolatum]|uniref:Hypp8459 protein n=1 Tax=Branchiostoma lanceolatum TaxID=7740 RepID=A0A8K0EFD8_BRALA|nr:Hypp8459 [Branchiostoma lanceolatum]
MTGDLVLPGASFAATVNKRRLLRNLSKPVMADFSYYLMVALCSFLAYFVVYSKLTPLILKTLVFRLYSSLDKSRQVYVNWLTASLLYTSVVGPCALLVHHFDQDLAKSAVLRYDSPAVRGISAILLGYTAGETVKTLTDVVDSTDLSLSEFLVHHVVSCCTTLVTCVSCFVCLPVYPCLPVYSNLVLATECSTIWLNIRLLLKEFGIPHSSAINRCNNFVFFLVFSYVRVWLLVVRMYIPLTSLLLTKEFYAMEVPVVVTFVFGSQFFVFINLNWYRRLCRRFSSNDLGYGNDG